MPPTGRRAHDGSIVNSPPRPFRTGGRVPSAGWLSLRADRGTAASVALPQRHRSGLPTIAVRALAPTHGEAHVPQKRLVCRLHARRDRRASRSAARSAASRIVLFRAEGGAGLGARGLLPAPRRAALARHGARRRPHRLRLPRPGDGRRRQVRRHAGAARRGFPTIQRYPAIERYGFVWVWPGDDGAGRSGEAASTCRGPRTPNGPTAAGSTT